MGSGKKSNHKKSKQDAEDSNSPTEKRKHRKRGKESENNDDATSHRKHRRKQRELAVNDDISDDSERKYRKRRRQSSEDSDVSHDKQKHRKGMRDSKKNMAVVTTSEDDGEKPRLRRDSGDSSKKKNLDLKHKKSSASTGLVADPPVALPGVAATLLLTPSQIRGLNVEAQFSFVSKTADLCERAIRAIDAGVAGLSAGLNEAKTSEANFTRSAVASEVHEHHVDENEIYASISSQITRVEDAVLADMVKLRGQPMAREFVEMTLWRRVRNINAKVLAEIEAECSQFGGKTGFVVNESHLVGDDAPRKSFAPSLKDVYMENLTESFAEDLERLRVEERMDGDRVNFLLRCLEEGADLFASLK